MKLKNIALAALLTVSAVNAMHPDLIGKNPAQVNGLYKALKARPMMGVGHDTSFDSTVQKAVPLAAVVAGAHVPDANTATDALLQSMHAGNYAAYVTHKVAVVKKVVGAVIDYLGDSAGANTGVLTAAAVGGAKNAGAMKAAFLPTYDAIIAMQGVGGLATPVDDKLSSIAVSLGALQVSFDAAIDPIAQALGVAGNTAIIDAAAVARVGGMAAAANAFAAGDQDIEDALVAFAGAGLANNQRDTFVAALKAAIDAVL